LLTVVTIVFPSKGDFAVVDIQQSIIGNGDAMRIAAQIGQDLFRSAEGAFSVNDPFDMTNWG
jgi:hypothetical protein